MPGIETAESNPIEERFQGKFSAISTRPSHSCLIQKGALHMHSNILRHLLVVKASIAHNRGLLRSFVQNKCEDLRFPPLIHLLSLSFLVVLSTFFSQCAEAPVQATFTDCFSPVVGEIGVLRAFLTQNDSSSNKKGGRAVPIIPTFLMYAV